MISSILQLLTVYSGRSFTCEVHPALIHGNAYFREDRGLEIIILFQNLAIINSYYLFNIGSIKSNLYLRLERKQEEAYLSGDKVGQKILHGYARVNNNFTISEKTGLEAEASFWYASPTIQGIYKLSERYALDLALKKKFGNNRGYASLFIYDVFYSDIYQLDVEVANQHNGFKEWNDTRGLVLPYPLILDRKSNHVSRIQLLKRKRGGCNVVITIKRSPCLRKGPLL